MKTKNVEFVSALQNPWKIWKYIWLDVRYTNDDLECDYKVKTLSEISKQQKRT